MSTRQKIESAADATDAIQGHVGEALKVLGDNFNGRIVNGWGVYADPSNRRWNLRTAIEALQKAQGIMDATQWPTSAEYEGAES